MKKNGKCFKCGRKEKEVVTAFEVVPCNADTFLICWICHDRLKELEEQAEMAIRSVREAYFA